MNDPTTERLRRILAQVEPHVTEGEAALERRGRFESESDATLSQLVLDPAQPRADRSTALAVLADRHRRSSHLSEFFATLFDDPDLELARQAIRSMPPFDPASVARLHALLDDPREPQRTEAALVLARRKDRKVLRVATSWLLIAEGNRRRVALTCLEWLLDPEDRLDLLRWAWKRTPDPDGRALLDQAIAQIEDEAVDP